MLGEQYDQDVDPVDLWILEIFNLYVRCRKLKDIALPQPGGIFEQDEILLKQLEIVHDVVARHESEIHKDMMSSMEQKGRVNAAKDNMPRQGRY